jgi:hypothetical protein
MNPQELAKWAESLPHNHIWQIEFGEPINRWAWIVAPDLATANQIAEKWIVENRRDKVEPRFKLTERPEPLVKWAEKQIQELIKIGYDAIEAERSVNWVLQHLPSGADPTTYIFPAEVLNEPLDQKAVDDARADWYASKAVPTVDKRILDAKSTVSKR